ncbi:ribosome biogenesis GTPase YlqF [Jeotgalibacillus haloalkalitolerans]|uniref:Ribosome biogenesis GTPase A n=1 Tax=Jeotgalibacillus haloalkalitolerans TaxID=3104292 RepID=A0ABU5KL77_9BACL|nr:ribosome biogenesis GTPase YlqF [Jeotgalibacillus sp. HH7-29]MDZ5711701.1 ribosome biogenesis GTPase YlqF [Jeotgalibacillus sp. HH7-29]
MSIQWFPGHMAKARRQVTEKLKLVDIVFELVDARIPLSSRNPMIEEIIGKKPRLILINKADMADPNKTKEWIAYFERKGIRAVAINSEKGSGLQQIQKETMNILSEKWERMKSRGIRPRAVRAMIVGIPNVGKSTLINRLAKKNIAQTGNRPGVTKAQQWIKAGKEMELLDTPGILWPKFEDPEVGYRLALTGAIKDNILNLQDIALYALRFLETYYPARLKERYSMDEIPQDPAALFDHIGRKRGCLMSGGEIDYDKTADIIVRDIRNVQFGALTFDLEHLEEE